MKSGYQVYLYFFPLRPFGVGGEAPVVGHEPIFERDLAHSNEIEGEKIRTRQ